MHQTTRGWRATGPVHFFKDEFGQCVKYLAAFAAYRWDVGVFTDGIEYEWCKFSEDMARYFGCYARFLRE